MTNIHLVNKRNEEYVIIPCPKSCKALLKAIEQGFYCKIERLIECI